MTSIPIRQRWQDRLREKLGSRSSSRQRSSGSTTQIALPETGSPKNDAPVDVGPSSAITNHASQAIEQSSTLDVSVNPTQSASSLIELRPKAADPNQSVLSEPPQTNLSPSFPVPSCPDIWAEALQRLKPEDQEAIEKLRPSNGPKSSPRPLSESIDEILTITRDAQKTCEDKLFKFKFKGREIIARDVVGKIVFWLKKFKEVGDVAVSFDPAQAALPWAGVRFLLQVAISENEQMGDLLLAIEKLSCLINRGTIYQKLYQPGVILTNAVENLRHSMVKLYAVMLQMMGLCYRMFSKRTGGRALHAIFNPDQVSEFLAQCRQLENDVEHEAHNCERERSQQADAECKRLLEALQMPVVRTDERVLSLLEKVKTADRLEILDWTSKVLYGANHQLVKEKRTVGTCEWLLSHESYQKWQMESSANILWLYGTAGTGKTFLTSKVIDDVQHSLASQPNQEGFAFFYCNRNEDERRQPLAVLRAFVRQLSTITGHETSIQSHFKIYVEKTRAAASEPTISDCSNLLLEFINIYPRTTLILDALDECDESNRILLINTFGKIVAEASNPVKILISSRPDGDIKEKLKNRANIGIDATKNDDDISKFINNEILNHRKWDSFPSDLKVEIVETLQERSRGMFQWAFLQIKELKKLQRPMDIRKRLGKLPKDLETAYDEIFNSIPDEQKGIAHRAFQWVMCARTPLKTQVMLPAICQDGSKSLAPLDGLDEDMALEFCHNLLVVDPVQKVWVPSHLSVIEYFETNVWSQSQANCLVASVCLSVLQSAVLHNREKYWRIKRRNFFEYDGDAKSIYSKHIIENDDHDSLSGQGLESLSFYARHHWPLHTQSIVDNSSKKIIAPLLEEFLGMPTNSSAAYRVWHRMVQEVDESTPGTSIFKSNLLGSDMLAPNSIACFGFCAFALDNILPNWHDLSWVEKDLRTRGENTLLQPESENTLLQLAVMSRSVRTCRAIIEHGVDVNTCIKYTRYASALVMAVGDQNLDLVMFLLKEARADVNLQVESRNFGSALVCAASLSRKDIVEYLIEEGKAVVDMQLKYGDYGSALVAAVCHGQQEVVKYLVEAGANVNMLATIGYYSSALIAASEGGKVEVVEYLVKAGAGVNILATSGNYGSALIAASEGGKVEVVEYLIKAGADVNMLATSEVYGSALIAASEGGRLEVVEYLVKAGAGVNILATSGNYGSALIAASEGGKVEVVEYLIKAGADVNMLATSEVYGSALIAASEGGRLEVVEYLVKAGAGVNILATSGNYGSALIAASYGGKVEVVEYLVKAGADVNMLATGGWYGSALIAASLEEEVKVVEYLVDAGAEVNMLATCGYYGSALIAASCIGRVEVVKYLVEAGAEVNIRTQVGEYPTAIAAAEASLTDGFIEKSKGIVVKFLREHGAEE